MTGHTIGFFIKERGQGIKDATIFRSNVTVPDNGYLNLRALAREAASYIWYHQDGWEWLTAGAVITLVLDGDKILGDLEITVEIEPVFTADKIDPKES